ncbi:MAG: ATP-binding protein [Candidatus Andeanibacterium colombiense]|uniref:ATP-binding protein n=1 Tax=Candidatus Andeanibacterium colombiense TaxID=3121345 RepID=A0AAJ5XBD0_9SPHN|nr:MAG: ATP-binding protein [Sphingomonadaceae bacterium]
MLMTRENTPVQGANSLYSLTPSQKRAYEHALATIAGAAITVIKGDVGSGKSLVVSHLQSQLGGSVYSLDQVVNEITKRGAGNAVETLVDFVVKAFSHDDLVFVEDVTMFDGLGGDAFVDRPRYLPHVMAAVYEKIMAAGVKLVIATADRLSSNNETKAAVVEMDGLAAEDYLAIIQNRATALAPNFDSDKVSRTYRKLTAYQISAAMNLLKEKDILQPSAEQFIETMDQIKARSNLVVDDVEDVSLDSLVGIDAITRELMRTIVIPMTQPELARELGLRPARGILLHGEPGTGKTTIGRALARQMKGKFFIMDGSVKPENADKLLAAAEASSPAVFFIDDADVIFKNGENSGFARKLLTKLDGLESESIGNVCIIMTAMDVADMPPAIVRSGRVEVWLHMELPDAQKRTDIIRYYAQSLPDDLKAFDEQALVNATEGFVPADLRGLVGDARGHIAFDRHKQREVKTFEEYLLRAADEIQDRKAMLSDLAGKPRAKRAKLPRVLAPPPCTEGNCD